MRRFHSESKRLTLMALIPALLGNSHLPIFEEQWWIGALMGRYVICYLRGQEEMTQLWRDLVPFRIYWRTNAYLYGASASAVPSGYYQSIL
jgi:hypothetical protein